MTKEHDFQPESENQEIKPSAIILCTNSQSSKALKMWESLSAGPYFNIPISAASAHTIPEHTYNDLLSSRPDEVAAVKCLQISDNHPNILSGLFGRENIDKIHPGYVVFIANDIMLDVCNKKGKWIACQKPLPKADKDDMYEILSRFLTGQELSYENEIPGRFRCGVAVCIVDHKGQRRGVCGILETFFNYQVFKESEIKAYLDSMDIETLRKLNFGMQWEHPLIYDHILRINSVERANEIGFEIQRVFFEKLILGGVPGLNDAIAKAVLFANSNAEGKATPDIKKMIKDHKFAIKNIGKWTLWHPQIF